MTLNFLEILIKLALGLFSLVFVINVTGKAIWRQIQRSTRFKTMSLVVLSVGDLQ